MSKIIYGAGQLCCYLQDLEEALPLKREFLVETGGEIPAAMLHLDDEGRFRFTVGGPVPCGAIPALGVVAYASALVMDYPQYPREYIFSRVVATIKEMDPELAKIVAEGEAVFLRWCAVKGDGPPEAEVSDECRAIFGTDGEWPSITGILGVPHGPADA